jgi:hypothetical protein
LILLLFNSLKEHRMVTVFCLFLGVLYGTSATETVTLRELSTILLKTELLVEYAKEFFDCPSLAGV